MIIDITFPGGKRVDAAFDGHVVHTDQSAEHGGEGSAPEPYDLFLASLATCAGAYVLGFCQARGLLSAQIKLEQRARFDAATRRLESVEIEVTLPAEFPEKYRTPLLRAIEGCKVKKTLASPPSISVVARTRAALSVAPGV